MKKKILFIVPSRSNGGVNSSLSGLYNSMMGEYDISVLSLTREGSGTYEFLNKTFSLSFLNSYFGNYSSLNTKEKFISYFSKGLKHFSFVFHCPLDKKILGCLIRRFEKANAYDHIVAFQEGQAAEIGSMFKNANKFAWIHCDMNNLGPSNGKEEAIYSGFKYIVCVSKYTRDVFISRYPSLEAKTKCIYNPVDSKRVELLSKMTVDDRRFDTGRFTIISVGRMDPVKRFPLIPQIASALKSHDCKFYWYVIGGPENEEYSKLQMAVKEKNVEDCVIPLGDKTNPYPYFKQADLYVSTSRSEACPMVFIEAQLCGIPIVTTNFGSSCEFIQNEVNGHVGTIDDLWLPIYTLIMNRPEYLRLQSNCNKSAIDNENIFKQLRLLFS